MRLSECSKKQIMKIEKICTNNYKLKQRLFDIGLVEDTVIKVKKEGNPIIIEIRDYELCISKDIASNIVTSKI